MSVRGRGDEDDRDDATPGKVRLDKWLWAARFFKTRSLAADALDGGKVEVNGERAKRAKLVQVNDRVRLRDGPYEWQLTVRDIAHRRGSAQIAQQLYDETSESRARREAVHAQLKSMPTAFSFGDSRPGNAIAVNCENSKAITCRDRAADQSDHLFFGVARFDGVGVRVKPASRRREAHSARIARIIDQEHRHHRRVCETLRRFGSTRRQSNAQRVEPRGRAQRTRERGPAGHRASVQQHGGTRCITHFRPPRGSSASTVCNVGMCR